jgi:integrase/recombinase XerD
MAKPDPIPQFIEIMPLAQSPTVALTEQVKESDWVDQFLSDREIRPNTQRAYLRHLRQFQTWLAFKPWHDVTEADIVC